MSSRESKTKGLKLLLESLKQNRRSAKTPITLRTPESSTSTKPTSSNQENSPSSESNLSSESELEFASEDEEITTVMAVFDVNKTRKSINSLRDFDGKKYGLERFLENIESIFNTIPETVDAVTVGQLYRYAINRLCPVSIYNKLKGKTIQTIDDFRNHMADAIIGPANINEINRTLTATTQGEDESIEAFASRIKTNEIALKIALKRTGIIGEEAKKLNEAMIFSSFIKNLKPELNKICIARDFKTIEDCVQEVSKTEQLINSTEIDNLSMMLQNIMQKQCDRATRKDDQATNGRRSNGNYAKFLEREFNNKRKYDGYNNHQRNVYHQPIEQQQSRYQANTRQNPNSYTNPQRQNYGSQNAQGTNNRFTPQNFQGYSNYARNNQQPNMNFAPQRYQGPSNQSHNRQQTNNSFIPRSFQTYANPNQNIQQRNPSNNYQQAPRQETAFNQQNNIPQNVNQNNASMPKNA